MPTKSLSCKKEAICVHGPETPSCPVGQGSFKMDCFKVEKCSMVRRVQITDAVSSGLKRRETFQHVISVQFKSRCISDGMGGCINSYSMGSLHVLEGHIQNHILQLLQQHGFIVEEFGCWIDLPAVQIFHQQGTFASSLNGKYVKDDHKLFSSWKPISGKNGIKSQHQNYRNS